MWSAISPGTGRLGRAGHIPSLFEPITGQVGATDQSTGR